MKYVDNPFESPLVISFCPGILGLERGLDRARVKCRVAAYVEIEAFIIANLVAGMEAGVLDPAPIWTDAKTFDARPFRGKVHGIIGGYPCPGESTAGLREGHLYKGFLWPAIRRAIQASRPLWCFFENVDDHLTGTYPIVQRSLRNMGYAVEAGIFTAEEVGSPQERKRIFILALANSLRDKLQRTLFTWDRWPQPSNSGGPLANPNNIPGGLPEYFIREETEVSWRSEEMDNPGSIRFESEHGLQAGRNSFIASGEELGDSQGSRSQELRNITIPVSDEKSQQERRRIQLGIAGTSSTQWPAGQGLFQYDWEEPRTIEPSLGCTIDGYNFREDLIRAIGNSVVEQTAEIAFKNLMQKHFEHKKI
jgi:site-specific DNA-cytosine methylase